MMSQSQPKGRFVPHKTLREGWTYFSVDDSEYVVGVKLSVTKVTRLEGPDGNPVTNADGTPGYFFTTQNVTKTLSGPEWEVQKKRIDNE